MTVVKGRGFIIQVIVLCGIFEQTEEMPRKPKVISTLLCGLLLWVALSFLGFVCLDYLYIYKM